MFGFLIGTLSLIGLMKLWRHGRHGNPRRWMFRRLFQRLDTTPGQEKVILEVADDVEKQVWAARDAFASTRGQFARAMRGEHFEGAAVDEAFARDQAALDEVKKALRAGMAKIHEALRPEQRAAVAELLEMRGGGCGGYGMHRMHGCGPRARWARGPMSQSNAVNL